ncbi:MAG: UbiA family prenyltransferase [Bacteroidota bacterium]|jgi:hypothetical protein
MIQFVKYRINSFATHNLLLYSNFFILFLASLSLQNTLITKDVYVTVLCYLSIGICGFLINDLFDKKQDLMVHKDNITNYFPTYFIVTLILVLTFTSLFVLHIISPYISFLIIIQLFLLFIYSNRKIRLKEKGLFGVITDAAYAHIIPEVILLVIINKYTTMLFVPISFLALSIAIGVRDILIHQINDIQLDRQSGTHTFAINHPDLSIKLIQVTNNLIGLLLLFFPMELYLKTDSTIILLISVLLLLLFVTVRLIANDYFDKTSNNGYLRIYVIISALILASYLIRQQCYLLIPLLLHPYALSFLKSIFHFLSIRLLHGFKIVGGYLFISAIPRAINLFIYLVFKFLGKDLKEKPLYEQKNEPEIFKKIRRFFSS